MEMNKLYKIEAKGKGEFKILKAIPEDQTQDFQNTQHWCS